MVVLPLLAVSFLMKIVAVIFVLCAVVLVLTILIQKGKGGGLSGAFGGAGGAGGILGSKTGDFLTWFTIALVAVFLLLSVLMAKFYKPSISEFGSPAESRQAAPVDSPQPVAPVTTADTNSLGN